jgi:N-acetyl-anhydromuramyl-L-alanine amidase AmpD
METAPPQQAASRAAIAQLQYDASTWRLARPWQRIVVHASRGGPDVLPQQCHFLIHASPGSSGWVTATPLWDRQQAGQHIYVAGQNFNDDSIGICLVGDFSTNGPSEEQFAALMALVHELQKRCDIPAECVYLNHELNPESTVPGPAFPSARFNQQLHRAP